MRTKRRCVDCGRVKFREHSRAIVKAAEKDGAALKAAFADVLTLMETNTEAAVCPNCMFDRLTAFGIEECDIEWRTVAPGEPVQMHKWVVNVEVAEPTP